MIIKNAEYGNTKNVVIAEFGKGDVHMIGSEGDENGGVHLAFKTTKEPQPINVIVDTNVSSYDEFQPEIVFIFNKSESIDSLISMLQECKKEMVK